MKIPKFTKSRKFIWDRGLPCLKARLRNSEIAGLGSITRKESKSDPFFTIYVRAPGPTLTPWQTKTLQDLLKGDGLRKAIEQGIREYATDSSWAGFADEDPSDRRDYKRDGIFPYVELVSIIIDEPAQETILELRTDKFLNLAEHGVVIYRQSGKWKFEYSEYLSTYVDKITSVPPDSSITPPQPRDIYGRWVFDPEATMALLKSRRWSKSEIKETIASLTGTEYIFSQNRFEIVSPNQPPWQDELVSVIVDGANVTFRLRDSVSGKESDEVFDHAGVDQLGVGNWIIRRVSK